jgi:hypothetical protein
MDTFSISRPGMSTDPFHNLEGVFILIPSMLKARLSMYLTSIGYKRHLYIF